MAIKHKSLYLYLTLACFLGIVLIFIFDGYMGVYDSLTIKAGEYPDQKIDADQWLLKYSDFSTAVEWNGKAFCQYEVDNRQFSSYTADVEVSVWHNQEKMRDLVARQMSINSFDKGQMEWVVNTAELVPADAPPEQGYEFTIVIKRGEVERRLFIHVRSAPYPPKIVIPAPTR